MKKIVKPNKQESGITLISLIVSIVILVILAAALINVSLDNVKIVDTAVDSSELYTIEQYQGTIEEGMQKEILEEAILGETITQTSIKEELNEIGDTVQTSCMTESETENVGDVIVITDEGYLFSAYYDENTGRQYVEYLGKGDSGSIPELYVSYSNGTISAVAKAKNENSIDKIEIMKSGESLDSAEGSSLSYSASTSGMYIVKVTTEEGISRYGYIYIKLTTDSLSAPKITLAGTSGSNGWYKSDVTATIENPNSSGTIKYMLSGVTNQDETTYSNALTLQTSGLTKVIAYVVDSDGYTSDYSYVNVKIDKEAPTDLSIDVISGTEGTNSWYTSDIVIEITAKDTNSGIYSYVYTIVNNTTGTTVASNVEVTGQSKEITFKTDGEYEITVYAVDRAGNTSDSFTTTIYKDSTSPNSFIPTVDTNSLTYSSFDVLATTTDSVSGVVYYEYYIKEANSSGDYELKQSSSSTTCTFDGLAKSTAYSVYVVAVDKAGNKETSSVITVKTAEEDRPISVEAEIVEELPTSVVIEVTATDENGDELTSGDDFTTTIKVKDENGDDVTKDVTITDNEDGTYTIGGLDQEAEYEIEITVTDNEGNEDTTTISTTTTKDTTAPTVNITVTDITTNSAVVNITATDDVSSLDGATYTIEVTDKNGNKSTYTTTSIPYKLEGLEENSTYEVKVSVSDETGNTGSKTETFLTGTMPTAATSGLTLTPSTEDWTNEAVTITATLSTNYTGYGVLISTDGGTEWTNTKTINVSENLTVKAKITDRK